MDMKKAGVILIIALLFLFPIIISISQAQTDSDNPTAGVPLVGNINPDKIPTDTESLKQTAGDYLSQERRKILENNPVGSVILKVWDFSKPVLKAIIGTEPGITWRFAISLALFILLLMFSLNMLKFSPFSGWVSSIIAIGITIIISTTKQIDKVAGFLEYLSSKWWGKVIILFIIIILAVASSILGKIAKADKEKKKKEQEELDRKKLHGEVEVAEKFTKSALEE